MKTRTLVATALLGFAVLASSPVLAQSSTFPAAASQPVQDYSFVNKYNN